LTIKFLRKILWDYVDEFREIIRPVVLNSRVQEMRGMPHHGDVCCFNHSLRVAKHSYAICRALRLDSQSAARGAMLHDFYLYERHRDSVPPITNLIMHPLIALDEAIASFDLNPTEMDIIRSHMWPLSVTAPKSAEAAVVCLTDKYITVKEYSMQLGQALRRGAVFTGRMITRRRRTV